MTPSRKRSGVQRPKPFPHFYGWVPDLPDHRDILYRAVTPPPLSVPQTVDLRSHCSPVEDQGKLGSCTANALVGALEFLEKEDGFKAVDLSRLFIYYNERVIEHAVTSDSGAALRDGIKTLAKQGVCDEAAWPYVISRFAKKPAVGCYREALDHTITSYQRILSVDEMVDCLASGFPFAFGFSVYESFESATVAKTGIVNMPASGERIMGGHAVLAVGYSQPEQRFIVRNSWGSGWGQHGYFTIPFAYLTDRNLSDDFWVIRRGENL